MYPPLVTPFACDPMANDVLYTSVSFFPDGPGPGLVSRVFYPFLHVNPPFNWLGFFAIQPPLLIRNIIVLLERQTPHFPFKRYLQVDNLIAGLG